MAMTSSALANCLKQAWTTKRMNDQFYQNHMFANAMRMEYQDLLKDQQRMYNRQLVGGTMPQYGMRYATVPVRLNPNLSTNPAFHRARVVEMERRLAAARRGGKPSYRQRQANARKAKARIR